MRIAFVSPYSWTYPGGVTRHIEALADQLSADGHHVRVLAPYDPPDARSARLHRGAVPQAREAPEYLIPLGRTLGIPANGAVSNLSLFPSSVFALRRALAEGDFDVVHVHEPIVPTLSWDALEYSGAALVGTYHTYGTNPITHNLGNLAGARRRMHRLHARIAVSEAAAWTAKRFFGGAYRIVPNGVHVPAEVPVHAPGEVGRLKIAFVGQAVERKGLPMLLSAFEGLREHVDATLTVVGATKEEVEHLLLDGRGITVLGRVSDEEKTRVLREADVLCAPSLGGESFGMVLTEAFAQGTPVVASDIAGYRDVVRDGRDGVLVPHGDAVALAETLRDLALDPARRAAMAAEAAVACAPLRLAARHRRGARRLRAGDRRARRCRPGDARPARRPAPGADRRRRQAEGAAPAPGEHRARGRRRAAHARPARCSAAPAWASPR